MAFGLGKRVLQHCVHTCELLHPSWFCHRCLVFICYKSSLKLCALVTMIMRMITRTKIQSGKVKVLGKGQLTSNTHRLICAWERGIEQANWSIALDSKPVTWRPLKGLQCFLGSTLYSFMFLCRFLSQFSCPECSAYPASRPSIRLCLLCCLRLSSLLLVCSVVCCPFASLYTGVLAKDSSAQVSHVLCPYRTLVRFPRPSTQFSLASLPMVRWQEQRNCRCNCNASRGICISVMLLNGSLLCKITLTGLSWQIFFLTTVLHRRC